MVRTGAADGNELTGPVDLTRVGLRLPAGGRYDLAYRAPDHPVALLVDNDRAAGLPVAPEPDDAPAVAEDTAGWPALDLTRYGTPAATPFDGHSRFDRHFTLVLDRGHLAVLITEACANAVMHADPDSTVDITISIDNEVCLLEVGNRGSTPNGAGLDAELPAPLTVGGRGLPLIAALADMAAFVAGPPDHVLLRITKHLTDVRTSPIR